MLSAQLGCSPSHARGHLARAEARPHGLGCNAARQHAAAQVSQPVHSCVHIGGILGPQPLGNRRCTWPVIEEGRVHGRMVAATGWRKSRNSLPSHHSLLWHPISAQAPPAGCCFSYATHQTRLMELTASMYSPQAQAVPPSTRSFCAQDAANQGCQGSNGKRESGHNRRSNQQARHSTAATRASQGSRAVDATVAATSARTCSVVPGKSVGSTAQVTSGSQWKISEVATLRMPPLDPLCSFAAPLWQFLCYNAAAAAVAAAAADQHVPSPA